MADPRLNSIHLESGRREEYRHARAGLLNARGWQTVAVDSPREAEYRAGEAATLLPRSDHPPSLTFWLQDRDYVYPLRVGLNTVGRSRDNDVILEDSYVSRRHCAILVHASLACELHDMASKNGTYLNGTKIAGPTRLAPGDEIRMCDRQLVFLGHGEAPPAHDKTITQEG